MREMRSSPRLSGLIAKILFQLFPSHCPSCDSPSDSVSLAPFCKKCWSGIRKYTGPSCERCATPFSSEDAVVCADCRQRPTLFSKASSFGIYEGILAEAINLYKFQGIRRLAGPLGALLSDFDATGFDAVIPVPLTIAGLRGRGFNQSLLLAKVFSDRKSIPLVIDGLLKCRETSPQIGLSARDRAKNLKGAFSAPGRFDGMRLLLVDDVMTTGSTANECAKQLLEAGAIDVSVLTLARASTL
jgi:ComF family protein